MVLSFQEDHYRVPIVIELPLSCVPSSDPSFSVGSWVQILGTDLMAQI